MHGPQKTHSYVYFFSILFIIFTCTTYIKPGYIKEVNLIDPFDISRFDVHDYLEKLFRFLEKKQWS